MPATFALPALALAFLNALPAAAQESVPIIISANTCAAVTAPSDAPDVAYQPGVDVEGRSVSPADLPGSEESATLARKLAASPVEITVDLRRRFGIPANAALFHGKCEIGYVMVKDCKAYLDGIPLGDSE